MKTISALRLAVASVLALGVVNANAAGSKFDDINVTAVVVSNCLISVADLDFGDYDPIYVNGVGGSGTAGLAQHKDVDTEVTMTCTKGSTPALQISLGSNAGVGTVRKLRKGATSDYLSYALYSDSFGGTEWDNTGAGVAATTPTGTTGGTGSDTTVIYGRIPSSQDVPVGSYSDIVRVTVNY